MALYPIKLDVLIENYKAKLLKVTYIFHTYKLSDQLRDYKEYSDFLAFSQNKSSI